MTSSVLPSRRAIVWTLRILVLALVCWGVGGTVRHALAELSKHDWHVQPAWLIAAGALYAIGLMPMGWFWQRTLAALGSPTPLVASMRGYFLGHIGKYVPGKAMSVILRVAAVRRWVPSMRIAIVSTLLETLTMMAVGAFLAALMSIFALQLDPLICLLAVAMALVAGAPTWPPLARRLAVLGIGLGKQTNEKNDAPPAPSADVVANLQGIDYRLLAQGWLAAGVCWLLLALSLCATLRAIGVDQLAPLKDLPLLIAAVAFAVVAGFISQLPAGLGVRDALLMQLLVPVCGDANALVAAVLMRLVWLVSELITCGILYIGARSGKSNSSNNV